MSARSWSLVLLFLVPPWAALLLACYWVFVDDAPPLRVVYQHPRFLTHEALSRADARRYEVESVESGGYVWVYRELCVDRPAWGSARGSWVSGSFVWQTPERSVPPMPTGCYAKSFNVRVPTSNPTRDFSYEVEWAFENNPLTTSVVRMEPVHLRVLAPGQAPTKMEPQP